MSNVTHRSRTKHNEGFFNGCTVVEERHTTYADDGYPFDLWCLTTYDKNGQAHQGKAPELEIAYSNLRDAMSQ